ncbi:hypothetical protein DVH24_021044 [Malus domestica]|uniref:Gnk2-homologous domain-containing protein n=1 Tax=Malus domestica TaxID=3750 RepID=A0A498JF51_MALDO|nr:hypothetical protein DVH24_021044 [Malus domestica]
MRGHFSVKSDVYSFGVLILEIINGQKNSSFRHSGNVKDLLSYVIDDHIIHFTFAMVSSRLIRLLFLCTQILLLIINVNFTEAQLEPPGLSAFQCSNGKGNYTTGSTYQTNLKSLLSTLFDANNNNGYGFYNSSLGVNNDRVYAIGLCRGDIPKEACGSCLTDTAKGLMNNCTNQKEAIEWLDNCMLRYSNRSIYGRKEISPAYYAWNPSNVSTGLDAFNQEVSTLLNGLRQKAATGGDLRKFATANTSIPSSNLKIYGLVQCTPELSEQSCIDCLNYAFRVFESCCSASIGMRIMTPSCGVRYENYTFFDVTTETPLPTPPADTAIPGGKKSNTSRTVIITVVTVVSVVLIISICIYLRVKKMKGKLGEADEILNTEALQFDLASIRTATNNFSEANKLGRGGFGTVYRIITGQKNSSFRHGGNVEDLLSYAWKSWKEDTASNLIDPLLKSGSIPEIMRCVHIGLLCVQQNIADRPTMAAVMLMLTTNSLDLPVPSQPAFFMDGGIESSSDTSLGWKDNSGVTRYTALVDVELKLIVNYAC